MNNTKKIVFSIIFSAMLTNNVNASIYYPEKPINKEDFEEKYVELSSNILSPFQIQGSFETGWHKGNFWNANDNGGVAIGPYQIHSKYLLEPFFNYLKNNSPKYYDMLNEKGGIKAIKKNNPEMREFFCELCHNDKEFVRLQENFIDTENFQPRIKTIKSLYGVDISSRSSSIEGIFRIMSANIGWRTNDVVKDMIKSNPNMDINSMSDIEFIKILQQSIHTVIKKDIKPKLRNNLINAYDKVINNDIIPNIRKEEIIAMRKFDIRKYNVSSLQSLDYTQKISIKHKVMDTPKKYFIKKDEEIVEVLLPQHSNDGNNPPLPSKKTDIITVNKVMEKKESSPRKPSLLHRAEMIRAQLNLEQEISLAGISQKKNKVVYKPQTVPTVEAVKEKVEKRKGKTEFDFSKILEEASSYII